MDRKEKATYVPSKFLDCLFSRSLFGRTTIRMRGEGRALSLLGYHGLRRPQDTLLDTFEVKGLWHMKKKKDGRIWRSSTYAMLVDTCSVVDDNATRTWRGLMTHL